MQFIQTAINIWNKYSSMFIDGIGSTLLVSLVGTVLGLVIGLIIGVIRTIPKSKNAFVRGIQTVANALISVYIEVFRGTPMMVQAMVIYWGFAFAAGGKTLPLMPAAILIVSINTGAYISEIVRGGIISIDKGQFEGAHAIGMSHFQTMIHVILPQVLRNILPAVSNEFVINIKDTSVLNVIGVTELYYQSYSVSQINYKIFETFAITCVIYFILTFTVTRILRFVEKKLDGKDNYTIFGSQTNPDAEIHVKGEGQHNG
jgi:putative lysine transport system permease protein